MKQCRNGGIDCKVHGIQLVGRNIAHALPMDDSAALARLLPPDFELEQVTSLQLLTFSYKTHVLLTHVSKYY